MGGSKFSELDVRCLFYRSTEAVDFQSDHLYYPSPSEDQSIGLNCAICHVGVVISG
jgi:hypothetical protein